MDQKAYQYLLNPSSELLTELLIDSQQFIKRCVAIIRLRPGLDREDMEQIGVLGFLAALGSYQSDRGAAFHTWATRKIRDYVLDAQRRACGNGKQYPQAVSLPDTLGTEDDLTFIEAGLSPHASQVLRSALRELPAAQALVLLLGVNGLSQRQIGDFIGYSQTYVHRLRQDALAALRKRLIRDLGE